MGSLFSPDMDHLCGRECNWWNFNHPEKKTFIKAAEKKMIKDRDDIMQVKFEKRERNVKRHRKERRIPPPLVCSPSSSRAFLNQKQLKKKNGRRLKRTNRTSIDGSNGLSSSHWLFPALLFPLPIELAADEHLNFWGMKSETFECNLEILGMNAGGLALARHRAATMGTSCSFSFSEVEMVPNFLCFATGFIRFSFSRNVFTTYFVGGDFSDPFTWILPSFTSKWVKWR